MSTMYKLENKTSDVILVYSVHWLKGVKVLKIDAIDLLHMCMCEGVVGFTRRCSSTEPFVKNSCSDNE